MGLLGRIFGGSNDRELAETRYAGRESASESAGRQRRTSYWRTGVPKAAKAGQDWEDADRNRERTGRRKRR